MKRDGHCQWGELDPANPCDQPIEARLVCRKHYPQLRKVLALAAAAPPKRTVGQAHVAETFERDPNAVRIARVVDIEVWQDYAQSTTDVRKKDMKQGVIWKGTAKVDTKASTRITEDEIKANNAARVARFVTEEMRRQKKNKMVFETITDAVAHLIWNPQHRPEAHQRFIRDVVLEEAGDWRQHYGGDRIHHRQVTALRPIDLVAAARRIGLGDKPDLGDKDVVAQIVAAIEEGKVKS